jgi:hypothetical protein
MPGQRGDTGGHFALEINRENAGFVKKFSGFAMEADIVSNDLGPDNVQKKHVANIRWTPGKATIAIGMGNECYQRIKAADLKLSISMADYPAWADSARKWFVDGQHLEENEMQGRITFLDPNMKDEIGGIDLINCGFKKFSQDDFEANSEKIARFNVELYVEKMVFELNHLDPP